MNSDRAIVMPSVGRRPWASAAASTFESYAAHCHADFIVEGKLPGREEFPLPDLPDRPGRPNKRAYALKAFLVWKYLAVLGYERVLVVDDSCCVTRTAPDIFEHVPGGHCGYTTTAKVHALKSFTSIERFEKQNGLAAVPKEPEKYMNSGVMVYDRSMAAAFHPDRIISCSDLLYAAYPNQTLTYYLLASARVPMHRLSKMFNKVPGQGDERKEMTDVSPYLGDAHIHHFTGGYVHRHALILQMAALINQSSTRLPDP